MIIDRSGKEMSLRGIILSGLEVLCGSREPAVNIAQTLSLALCVNCWFLSNSLLSIITDAISVELYN